MSGQPPSLSCFEGHPAPGPVVDGWQAFLALPRKAADQIWPLLDRALSDPENAENRPLVERYCAQFQLNPAQVLAALRACDFLLRQAAALDLTDEQLRADLETLSGDDPSGVETIMSRFAAARSRLQAVILEDTLADHGNVLVGLEWRVDRVDVSHRGRCRETPVMFLSLRYRNGDDVQRLSLQLTPEAFGSLRAFCERFADVEDDQ